MNSKYTQFTSQSNLPGIIVFIDVVNRCSSLLDDAALRFVMNAPLFCPHGVLYFEKTTVPKQWPPEEEGGLSLSVENWCVTEHHICEVGC